ncbi:MAG: ribonuclease HI [Bacteroidota bacterium]
MVFSAKKVIMHTDGACLGNPGRGGYGTILEYGHRKQELARGFSWTTNNRMELWAVIAGIESLPGMGWNIIIYTDSRYVVNAIEKKWLNSWIRNSFKGKKNKDLWQRFWKLSQQNQVKLHWVKGHAGHPLNEHCDQLAVAAAMKGPWQEDLEYLRTTQSI